MKFLIRAIPVYLAFAALCGGQVESSIIINFNAFQQNNTGDAHGEYDWGTQITVNGFTVTATPTGIPGTQQFAMLSTLGPLYPAYPGVPAMYNRQSTGGLILTKAGGGTFLLASIDLVELPGFYSDGTAVRSPTGQFDVAFTGNRTDGSTVSAIATVLDFADVPHLQTFSFSNFHDLVSVTWRQGAGGGYDHYGNWQGGNTHEFDNIVVEPEDLPPPASVPVPSTLTMSTIFLGMYALKLSARRAKLAAAAGTAVLH